MTRTTRKSRKGSARPMRAAAHRSKDDETRARKPRKGIQSVEIGLRVLDALARSSGPQALKDISRITALPPSQAHRYLASLMNAEMVVQDAVSGRYDLGKMALRIGLSALSRIDVVQVAEDGLKSLVERVPQTAMIGIWSDHGPTAVRWRRGRSLIFASVGVGASFPLLQSATGNAFLAYLPTSITRPLVAAELKDAANKRAARTQADVEAIIATVRKQGYSGLDGHFVPGMWALAAPIFDFQGEIVAALTLIGNSSEGPEARAYARDELLRTVRDASERLGFQDYWPGALDAPKGSGDRHAPAAG